MWLLLSANTASEDVSQEIYTWTSAFGSKEWLVSDLGYNFKIILMYDMTK